MKACHADGVYLTFDDGPDPLWTPRLLDLLAMSGCRATFFLIGRNARCHPALVRRILAEGHALGNHTWSHAHPRLLPPGAARREVRDGAHAIEDITGCQLRLFRPPHGVLRRAMMEAAAELGEQATLWSHSAVDWGPLGTIRAIGRRLAAIRPGGIVLMHDGRGRINHPDRLLTVLPHQLRIFNVQRRRCLTLTCLPPANGERRSPCSASVA